MFLRINVHYWGGQKVLEFVGISSKINQEDT